MFAPPRMICPITPLARCLALLLRRPRSHSLRAVGSMSARYPSVLVSKSPRGSIESAPTYAATVDWLFFRARCSSIFPALPSSGPRQFFPREPFSRGPCAWSPLYQARLGTCAHVQNQCAPRLRSCLRRALSSRTCRSSPHLLRLNFTTRLGPLYIRSFHVLRVSLHMRRLSSGHFIGRKLRE